MIFPPQRCSQVATRKKKVRTISRKKMMGPGVGGSSFFFGEVPNFLRALKGNQKENISKFRGPRSEAQKPLLYALANN